MFLELTELTKDLSPLKLESEYRTNRVHGDP